MNILFGINLNPEQIVENMILDLYKKKSDSEFKIFKEYDLFSIKKKLDEDKMDYLILNEELERDNLVDIAYLDELSDKHSNLKIILIVNSSQEKSEFTRRLFGLGIYNIIFSDDLTIESIVELIIAPRNKREGKLALSIGDIDNILVEDGELISDYEVDNIIGYLRSIELDEFEGAMEYVSNQYNEVEMNYLYKNLPKDIQARYISIKKGHTSNKEDERVREVREVREEIEEVKEVKGVTEEKKEVHEKKEGIVSKEVLEAAKRFSFLQKKQSAKKEEVKEAHKESLPKKDKVDKPTKKVKKEYVNVVPDDYKKVIAILGERKSGKTTMTYILSNLYSRDKKVVVLDFTENGSFSDRAWGNDDVKEGEDIQSIKVNSNFVVVKPKENIDVLDLIERYKYQNDILLIEANEDFPVNVLKWIDEIVYMSTLNIMDVKISKDYLRNAMLQGVNTRKIHLVINKYVKCKVSTKDIYNLFIDPIPFIEEEGDGIIINERYFSIPFDMEYYKNNISNAIYVDTETKITASIESAIRELAETIYPVGGKVKKSILGKINIFKKEF